MNLVAWQEIRNFETFQVLRPKKLETKGESLCMLHMETPVDRIHCQLCIQFWGLEESALEVEMCVICLQKAETRVVV